MPSLTRGALRVLSRLARERRGQAAVEIALVMPVFILLLASLVQVARVWNVQHTLAEAARLGARAASLANTAIDEDSVRSTVGGTLRAAALDPDRATVTVVGVDAASGDQASVQIAYPYALPLMHRLSGGAARASLDLSASAVMRHE